MPADMLASWEKNYRTAAGRDGCAALAEHLERIGYEADPRLLLEGTILLVRMSAAYLSIDNRPVDRFLSRQAYNPPPAQAMPYIFTFDLCGEAYARVFAGTGQDKMIDLADLLNSPWQGFGVAGYYEFVISRTDLKPFTVREARALKRLVKDDLYYDYSRSELNVSFDEYGGRSFLQTTVAEKPERRA